MTTTQLDHIRTTLRSTRADCDRARIHCYHIQRLTTGEAQSHAIEAADLAWHAYERLSNLLRRIEGET